MGELEDLRTRVEELTRALAEAQSRGALAATTAAPAGTAGTPMRSPAAPDMAPGATPVAVFKFDPGGTFTHHERKGSFDSRAVPGQLIGRSIFEPYGSVPGGAEAIRRALAGETVRFECALGADHLDVVLVPERDARGAVVHVTGVAMDITTRRRAEAAMRASEARFRGVLEKSTEVVFLSDREGRTFFVSPSVRAQLGFAPAEIVGRSFGDLMFPEDRGAARAARDALRGNPGASRTLSFRVRRKDGSMLWAEATLTNLLDDADVGAMVLNARDVSARHEAEEQLRASQQALEQAQQIARVGSWSSGFAPDECIAWSRECARIFGRDWQHPPTLVDFQTFVHPDDRERAARLFAQALADGAPYRADQRMLYPDGGSFWAQSHIEILRDEAHNPVRMLGILQDVTEQKRAREALSASEERYRRIVETTSDGVLTADAALRVTFANGPFAELLGYARDELVGRSVLDLVSPGADAAATEQLVRGWCLAEGRFDLRLRHKTGREVRTIAHGTPLVTPAGEREGVLAQFSDLTDRRDRLAQQNALAAIVENSQDAIISRALDGTILTWNPGAEKLLGYTAEEAVGRSIAMLYPAERMAELTGVREGVNEGVIPDSLVIDAVRKDGARVELAVRLSQLRDADGEVCGGSIIASDMTAQRRAEAGQRQAEEKLRQAQKMESIGRLAGGIAHDFNNLLTVILSYTELALSDLAPDAPLRADLEQVALAGQRAASLTRQLLAFSRQQVLAPRTLDLNAALRALEKMLTRVLGEDIQLSLLLDPLLGAVFADQGQIEQVILNLVLNARDAMPEGGALTIETDNVDVDDALAGELPGLSPGRYVRLVVTDTGTGMEPAVVARVFEPFFTTKAAGKGTGLGLATVFGIVRQSGGLVTVYSEPGVGSAFKVYLPRTVDAPASATVPPTSAPRAGHETLLLVEDDPAVRAIMRTMLTRNGYEVLVAPNGAEALLLAEQHAGRIDLLVTDVVMPQMNGRQLAERFAVLRPDARVLYVSGYTENTIIQHGILDSGVSYLQKPVTPDTLGRKVREMLGGEQAR